MFPKFCSISLVISLLLPSFGFAKAGSKPSVKSSFQKSNFNHSFNQSGLIDLKSIVENKNLYFSADTASCFRPGGSFLSSYDYLLKNQNDECKEKSNRARMQSTFFNIMTSYQCKNTDLESALLTRDEKISLCKTNSAQLSTLFNKFSSYDSNKDDFGTSSKMKCTILILAGAKKHMSLDNSLNKMLENISVKESGDGKLSALNNLVDKLYVKDQLKIRRCNFKLTDETKCVSGIENNTILAIVSKLTLKDNSQKSLSDLEILQTLGIDALKQSRTQVNIKDSSTEGTGQVKPIVKKDNEENLVVKKDKEQVYDFLLAGLEGGNIFSIQKQVQVPLQPTNSGERKPASVSQETKLTENAIKLLDIFKPFGFDIDKISNDFKQRIASKTKDEERKILSELLIELSNMAYDKECSNSILYNQANFCKKLNEEMENINKTPNEILMDNISTYVKDHKKAGNESMYRDISPDAIATLADNPANFKMNYADFLNKLNLMENCVNKFGDNSFSKIDDKTQYESFNKVITKFVKDQNEKELDRAEENAGNYFKRSNTLSSRIMASNFAETKSDDAKVEFLNSLRKDTISQISGGAISNNVNDSLQNKVLGAQNNSAQNNSIIGDSSLLDKGMFNNLGSSIKNNGQLNTVNAPNNSFVSSQPVVGSNNGFIERQNTFNENNLIQKKLDELTAKENSLKDKLNSEGMSSSSSKEMDSLQKQIEELRNQLADSKKDTAKAINQATLAKDNTNKEIQTVVNTVAPLYDFKKTYGSPNMKKDDRNIDNNSIDNSRFESGSIGSTASVPGAQAIASRSISSTGGLRSSESVKNFGLVLTKSGEVTEDITKIADNPKDADILVLAEKSNGKPFIIRENGDLVQVQIKLDANGRPVYINGRPELLKKKLSKDAQIQVAKKLDSIREAKEVRDTVRLQQLNQLMLESK